MYTVFVRGIEAYAYHGVPPEERVVGHRYVVDVELEVAGSADRTDKVADTVDYGVLGKLVESTVRETQFHTVEKLASTLLTRIMEVDSRIAEATVTVEKPMPPMPVIAEASGVRLTRSRSR